MVSESVFETHLAPRAFELVAFFPTSSHQVRPAHTESHHFSAMAIFCSDFLAPKVLYPPQNSRDLLRLRFFLFFGGGGKQHPHSSLVGTCARPPPRGGPCMYVWVLGELRSLDWDDYAYVFVLLSLFVSLLVRSARANKSRRSDGTPLQGPSSILERCSLIAFWGRFPWRGGISIPSVLRSPKMTP